MGTYPLTPRADFLNWCEAHVGTFTGHAVAIGLTPVQASAFKAATDDAGAAATDQEIARQAAMSATDTATLKFAALKASAAEMVRTIRAFAENSGDENVYTLANIPMPTPPQPVPPPAQPTDLRVGLDPATGAINLSWKASNPAGASGTTYLIRRRADAAGDFEFVGVTGSKKWTDQTFMAGPDSVQYTVQGQRADAQGPVSPILTVNFGRTGAGGGGVGGGFSVSSFTTSAPMPTAQAA